MSEIDRDIFTYDNGFKQCISGHGRNLLELSRFALGSNKTAEDRNESMQLIEFHVNQLVCWCQHFNGENQWMKKVVAAAESLKADLSGNADSRLNDQYTLVETVRVNALLKALEEG